MQFFIGCLLTHKKFNLYILYMFKKSLKKGGLFMDGKKEKCGGARKKNVQRVIKYVDVNQKKNLKGFF